MNDVAISRCAPLACALALVGDVIIGKRLLQVLRLQLAWPCPRPLCPSTASLEEERAGPESHV